AHAGLCRIDPGTWTVSGVLHQPCMNDLHHVAVHDGRLLAANSGLDRVDVFEMSGRFVGGWDLSPAWVTAQRLGGCNPSPSSWADALQCGWKPAPRTLEDQAFPRNFEDAADLSLPFTTRKTRHFVHPNHIAIVAGRPLVTRFIDRSIQNLADW